MPILGGEHRRAAGGRRQLGARAERRAAAAEHREHLGLELEAVERAAFQILDRGDAPGLQPDAHAPRRGRPRRRRGPLGELDGRPRGAVLARHERVRRVRDRPVAEPVELAGERAAGHRLAERERRGRGIHARAAERRPGQVAPHARVEPHHDQRRAEADDKAADEEPAPQTHHASLLPAAEDFFTWPLVKPVRPGL